MNLKYFFGCFIAIPLLPLIYVQGKRIRASVPKLPEAKGTEGYVDMNSSKNLRVIAIGESTIAGVGVETQEEGFSGTMAKDLGDKLHANIFWKVYARSGYTTKRTTEKTLKHIPDHSADLIVIGLGGNDAFTLTTPKKWRIHTQELINELRVKFGRNVPIAFMNMPPIKGFPAFTKPIKFIIGNLVEILGEELEKLTESTPNVYYYSRVITLEDWIHRLNVDADPKDFFSDGVHPSRLTYQVWAKDFSNFLIESIQFRYQSKELN
ncbi:MAG: SGNH/GDSL hydrolase family protein [Balneolaceae bacterium]